MGKLLGISFTRNQQYYDDIQREEFAVI